MYSADTKLGIVGLHNSHRLSDVTEIELVYSLQRYWSRQRGGQIG